MQRGHTKLKDIFIARNNMPRGRYGDMIEDGKMSIEYIPTGLHYDLIYNGMHKPKKKIKYPLIYVGNGRSRVKRFREYYQNTGVDIFGNWNENLIESFGNVNYHGKISQPDVRKKYRNSCCTILIGDQIYEDLGWWTPRIMEAIANGCIVLVHTGYKNYKELDLPDYCYVKDRQHALQTVNKLNKLRTSTRFDVVDLQQHAIRQWNIYRWGKSFRRIVERYDELKLWKNTKR